MNTDAVPTYEKPPYFPPDHFSLKIAVITGWLIAAPGLVIVIVSLAVILASERRTKRAV